MKNGDIVYIRVPAPLRNITNGNNKIEIDLGNIDGNRIMTIMEYVDNQFPGFKEKIFDSSGNLRQFINIFINGEDSRYLEGINTKINPGDEISIVPAVAGGFN